MSAMDYYEKKRLRIAASRATRLYPGPVGEVISRELLSWEQFGYRLGASQLMTRLVDHVLHAPLSGQRDGRGAGAESASSITRTENHAARKTLLASGMGDFRHGQTSV